MFERFTTTSRQVVTHAFAEAEALRHPSVGTEHLLLGLLDQEGDGTRAILLDAGLTRDRVQADIVRLRDDRLGAADADALQAIGIDLPTVRAKLEEIFGPGALDPPAPPPRRGLFRRRSMPAPVPRAGTPRWDRRAKKVLELSLREAIALRSRTIATEHILLGLLREGEGLATKIIVDSGVAVADLRARTLDSLKAAT
jgi:ATP-dependent Clp protease ATP-binding subunit ClpA